MSLKMDLKDPFLNLHKSQFLGLFLKSILEGSSMLYIQRADPWVEAIHRNLENKRKRGDLPVPTTVS